MSGANGSGSVEALVTELVDARATFLRALDGVDRRLLTAPGLLGAWSARELIAHLGYWAGHVMEAIHWAEQGRAGEFEPDGVDTDARNATVARVAADTDLATVRKREAASYEALVERIRDLDPALLGATLGNGTTLEAAIREDGSEHYREHAADVAAWFAGMADEVDEVDEVDEEPEEADADGPQVDR